MLEGDPKNSLVDRDIKEQVETSSKKKYIIIGSVCGCVVVAALVILLVIFLREDEDSKEDGKKELKFLTWEEAHAKAKEKLKEFNEDDKLNILFGIQNMQKKTEDGGCVGAIEPIENKFGGICLQDGPAGVRFSTSTQSWQAAINTASTFNRTLMYEVGRAQGKEFREKGIHVALTPAMNIQRTPQGGRLWESYGDDPFLSGVAATEVIKGVQSNGVIACAKHYVGNDQETNRHKASSNIKEQALWEVYLDPFIRSVKDGEVGSVMAAYSAVNGSFCVNNSRIVQNYLKNIIGYQGYVMSDWWAIGSDDPNIFNSGIDMNMPGGKYEGPDSVGRDQSFWSNFKEHLGKEISYERLDDAVERILAPMYKLDQFSTDIEYPKIDLMKNTITEETKRINREAATQSNVLLKNEDNILPIKDMKGKTIAIIGNDAIESPCIRDSDCSCKSGDNDIYKGHIALGYGSGTTYFNYSISPLSAITSRAEKEGINIISSTDINKVQETLDGHTIDVGKDDIDKAKEIAEKADLCIVFINADSGEFYIELERSHGDRYDLDAWHSGNELVQAVLEKNKNVIVVINAPGPINLPFLNDIKGLIFSGLGGAESGNGLVNILFGDYNPSGHLPYVWGNIDDYPTKIDIYTEPLNYEYTEGVFVGQRYFDKYNKTYTFPFGYGLSYTSFELIQNSLSVEMTLEGLKVNFEIKNIGNIEGETVPMVFLKFPDGIETEEGYPDKLFKGFDKKLIKPNEIVKFEIFIDDHALSYYNIYEEKFVRPNDGKYIVYVGFNAEDYNLLEAEVNASN